MSETTTPAVPAVVPVTWIEKVEKLGAIGVTVLIYALLAVEMVIAATHDTSSNQTFTNIVGTTLTLAVLSAGYWVGSSKGSADKTEALIKQAAPPTTTTVVEPAKATTTTAPTPVVQPAVVP